MRGRNKPWAKDYIDAHNELIYKLDEDINLPLTLEVGIGKGDFLVANAKDNLDFFHIGVEMMTSIFAIAMKKVVNENVTNVRMLNIMAEKLPEYIKKKSISKLYLNFSDPWPQNPKRRKRLVHAKHLSIFETLLVDNGEITFKTDNLPLFEMAVNNFKIRNYEITFLSYDYQTVKKDYVSEYEAKFRALGQPIYRISAKVNKSILHDWGDAIK